MFEHAVCGNDFVDLCSWVFLGFMLLVLPLQITFCAYDVCLYSFEVLRYVLLSSCDKENNQSSFLVYIVFAHYCGLVNWTMK